MGQSSHTIRFLVTHSGPFHADDVCALAVLTTLHPNAHTVRTRSEAKIASLAPDAITFDVGGIYDANQRQFDHHQKGRALRPDTQVPYSSFGLIWKHYGQDYLAALGVAPDLIPQVHNEMDKTLVLDIDAVDNGELLPGQDALLHPQALPNLLVSMRPDFDAANDTTMMEAFREAAALADILIKTRVRTITASLRSEQIIERAIANRTHPQWLELPASMPYDEVIHRLGADDILFVINPSGNNWQVNTVAQTLGQYGARKDLPAEWAGLRDKDLQVLTQVEDAVFCHIARFVASAQTRIGAFALLDIALRD